MHQTPDVPGTSPVTDNPNPNNTQGPVPTAPGTDTGNPGPRDYGNVNPSGRTPANVGNVNPQDPTAGTESAERSGGGNMSTGAVPAYPGDTRDVSAADAFGGDTGPEPGVFRCADAGFADCRWEATSAATKT